VNPTEQFLGTILVNLIIGVYVYGQLTQRVKDLSSWSKKHDSNLDEHGRLLLNHEGRISHFEGLKNVKFGGG
jgi:hypothetical protein